MKRERQDGRLCGKTVVVTGTAGGQGRAVARLFAREGAKVVGCDVNVEGSREILELVRSSGGDMVSQEPVDLTDGAAVKAFIEFAVAQYGDFDVLYNNAATFVRGRTVPTMTRDDWDFSVANELTLVFLTVQSAVPVFERRGGGSIINVASVAGMVGSGLPGNATGNLAHSVLKGAVIRLTETLAIELADLNVRVNSISPGPVETAAVARFISHDGLREVFEQSCLLGRLAQVDDIAYAALFLASDEASYITGVNLPVDGGFTVSGGRGSAKPALQQLFHAAETPGAKAVTEKP